jgi:CubicO group peptidase (beta-lactamase class C family)
MLLSYARSSRLMAVSLTVLFATNVALAQTTTRDRVAAALPTLKAMAEQAVESGATPGLAIAIVYDDEVVMLEGFGLREVGRRETVGPETVFQIASLSKPISSTVVAALVSDGLVAWDGRVAELDPAFRLRDPYPTSELTIRDLFAHRSGLPGNAGDELEDIGYDRTTVLSRLRLVSPASSFRAGYSYSNFGLTEGAIAAAKSTGEDWETVAEEKLYRPLGMASASSRYADFIKRPNRAALHVRVDGAWAATLNRDPDAQAPAGGVSASARDLAQWMRLELADGVIDGKRLIASDALAQTHIPLMTRGANPVTGAESFYGLGWNIEFGRHGLSWSHAGAFSRGARTLVMLYPKAKLGVLVLANAFPTGVPEGLADSFADIVFDGKVAKDWVAAWDAIYEGLFGPAVATAKAQYAAPPSPATPALSNDVYKGRYANAYLGEAIISDGKDGLTLKVGPGAARAYALRHFDRDLFLDYPDPESPNAPSAVRFAIGPDGRASAVTIDSLNGVGLGTLGRVGD